MADRTPKQGAGILGVGVAACVACCIPPIIGFLVAASIGTVISVAVFGLAGLAVLAVIVVAYMRRRRSHHHERPHENAPVPVLLGRKPDA